MRIPLLVKNNININSPIGVFDSGLGGLTVLKSLIKKFPKESFIYFGDTAHVPYGNKSTKTIIKYANNILDFFSKHQTKAIIIACNTVSSLAYDKLQNGFNIKLFDVVSPSVDFSIKQSITKNIGVIGTTNTITSKAYSKLFNKKNVEFSVYEKDCPLFVPIIEEGWSNTLISKQIAEIYLNNFNNKNIDILILGCTHYPIMADTIKSVLKHDVQMVFSGETVGDKIHTYFQKNNLFANSDNISKIEFYVSDYPKKFENLGSKFFGESLNNVNYKSIE